MRRPVRATSLRPSVDPGDKYRGLDRFGRVADQRWIKFDDVANPKDRFGYGYDRNSNRLYRENLVSGAAAFSELYHANGASNGYDVQNQLVAFSRGTLNAAKDTIASPVTSQAWTLDMMGVSKKRRVP